MSKTTACLIAGGSLAVLALLCLRLGPRQPETPVSAPRPPMPSQVAAQAGAPATPRPPHPLLGMADDAVLATGGGSARSTAGPKLVETARAVIESGERDSGLAPLTVDYPQQESIVPPEMVAPTLLWHEPTAQADTWVITVAFGDGSAPLRFLSRGAPAPAGWIDPTCIGETNEIYQPTPYQASARSWTPSPGAWAAIKQRCPGRPVTITILGFSSAGPASARSRGQTTVTVSTDPVGAPIFYRDVPLAPSETEEGVIKPLGDTSVTLIAWRLRDISRPRSRLLLTDVPSCTNCHSFSADGKTLGMDMDGPTGDKGAYVITELQKETVIEKEHIISWNSFTGKPEDHKTIGFLSQVSPDGQYAVTTLNEQVYVCNFLDYKFLQVFYPTRGILGFYSRADKQIRTLPGADNPEYVHCDAVWSPDGEYLVFARAKAKEAYPEGYKLAEYANDPTELPMQYDLYRMPFNDGRGGTPEPIIGASNNDMSNTFPKVSPDGRWIVFVKCRNGQLMRPDSELWILPAEGGEARRMRCNTSLMNSWHSFSPNGRWMVFSSKVNTPYTQMFLTHIDEDGNDSPPILVPNSTAANRAVNIPEFVNVPYDELQRIEVPTFEYRRHAIRAVESAKKGMLDEAMDDFGKAIEANPEYIGGQVNVACLLIEKGRLDEAEQRLRRVLQLDPKRADAHCGLGVILAKSGETDQAITHFKAAVDVRPEFAGGHVNLGRAFLEKGMLDKAASCYEAALYLSPKDARNHFDLGNVLFKQGKLNGAAACFVEALELNPGMVNARTMLGKIQAARAQAGPVRVGPLRDAAPP